MEGYNLVYDSAFHIEALNGFPGPYVKHVVDMIGGEGILKLMEGVENRRAYFMQVIAYADEEGIIHTFLCDEDTYEGQVSDDLGDAPPGHSWGATWRIYQPAWADKPLSEISADELKRRSSILLPGSEFSKFIHWIQTL